MRTFDKRYSSTRWSNLRKLVMARDSMACRMCGGIVKAGRSGDKVAIVDHIVPHNGEKFLFWDIENLWLVCKYCHDSACQTIEKRNKGNAEAIKSEKLSYSIGLYDDNGFPLSPNHHWNNP